MNNRLVSQNHQPKPPGPGEGRKAAALYKLFEALINEEYERCPELIRQAKAYGATQLEVRVLLGGQIRGVHKRPLN